MGEFWYTVGKGKGECGMANKKLKTLLLAEYLQQETDENDPKTVQQMIDYLARQGITAERKSVYDDLHLLEQMGMDIQTVKAKHFGYYLGSRTFQLAELKLLTDVVQASAFLTGKKSMELIGKLATLTSRRQAGQLKRQVYVMNRLRTVNETVYYTVDALHSAISRGRKVAFRYFDWTVDGERAFRRNGEDYEVSPVALCVDRQYYLVTYSRQTGFRHYRVDRMTQLRVLETCREEPEEHFDLGEYVKTIFDMFSGETATVRLRMEKSLLNAAMDRFGPEVHRVDTGDGWFELWAPVEVGPTFFGWLFQFGRQAELLEPEAVRQAFARHGRQALAQYEEGCPAEQENG